MLPLIIILSVLLSCPAPAQATINQELCTALAKTQPEDLEKAIAYCSQALEENQTSPALQLILANLLYQARDYQGALTFAEASVKLSPARAETHQLLGKIYTKNENAPKAIEHFQQALALNPNNIENVSNMGFISWLKKDYAAALGFFNQAINIDKYNPQYDEIAGDCQSYLKDFDNALNNLVSSSVLDPNPRIFLKIAQLLSVMKHFEEASKYLIKTVRYKPNDPELRERLAKTLALAHLKEEARVAYLETANIYKQMGFLQKAKEMVKKAQL